MIRDDGKYIVVDRTSKVPHRRFWSVEDAADYIIKWRAFARWTIMAQDDTSSRNVTRTLNKHERQRMERRLYPTLFE